MAGWKLRRMVVDDQPALRGLSVHIGKAGGHRFCFSFLGVGEGVKAAVDGEVTKHADVFLVHCPFKVLLGGEYVEILLAAAAGRKMQNYAGRIMHNL